MIRQKGVFASSEVDAHGEQLSPEALQVLVDQMNSKWIPVGVEHDPRIPPRGRVLSARLVERADGIKVVEGETELFEENDALPLGSDSREMPLVKTGTDTIYLDDRIERR